MKPFRGVVGGCALLLLAFGASPVEAAWCNVFQVCCNSCRPSVSASYYAPPAVACDPCPQQVCTTRYVQRCYYQPVTSYQTKTYYEPVTTYRTSYYYEPVTSYRYSCYYDPCTCRYQQVACPVTSYRLRAQCCPVQSWVQRCCYVPVTTYRQAFYYEPVTTCCTTTTGPAIAAPPDCPPHQAPAAQVPAAQVPALNGQTQPPPTITEQRSSPAPGVLESPGTGTNGSQPYLRPYDRSTDTLQPRAPLPPGTGTGSFGGNHQDSMPKASGISLQPLVPRGRAPARPLPPPPPKVKLDRIVALPEARVEGQVVRGEKVPWSGARLLFVSTDRQIPQQTATADGAGKFRVELASGGWLVYVNGTDGKPVFHSKIDVRERENRPVMLVSR
jgi:hypothetical protein